MLDNFLKKHHIQTPTLIVIAIFFVGERNFSAPPTPLCINLFDAVINLIAWEYDENMTMFYFYFIFLTCFSSRDFIFWSKCALGIVEVARKKFKD